jgi:Mlc titration factor MtfA (ptsG expression regulator)
VFHHHGLPDDWRGIVESHCALWPLLSADEQADLAEVADWLLRHKHWEASGGFALTEEITVTIAAQGALLVLGLDVGELRELRAIVVYPTTMQSQGVRAGPVPGTVTDDVFPVLGEAHDRRGPVLLAWDQASRDAATLGTGNNVVCHELAHKLDMLDGTIDGTPLLGGRVDLDRWVAVCTEAYDALRAGARRPPLRDYGATNLGEFFAVATEAFFDAPQALRAHEPDLYDILRAYYAQDSAARFDRAGLAPR